MIIVKTGWVDVPFRARRRGRTLASSRPGQPVYQKKLVTLTLRLTSTLLAAAARQSAVQHGRMYSRRLPSRCARIASGVRRFPSHRGPGPVCSCSSWSPRLLGCRLCRATAQIVHALQSAGHDDVSRRVAGEALGHVLGVERSPRLPTDLHTTVTFHVDCVWLLMVAVQHVDMVGGGDQL